MSLDPVAATSIRTPEKKEEDRTKGMQILSDALDAQRNRAEDRWNAATSQMRTSWIPGRDAERRITAMKHEPERRSHWPPEQRRLLGICGKSIHNASVAFDVIKSGRIGSAGSTGTTLGRSLVAAQDLVDKLIDEIRTTQRITDGVTIKGQSSGSRVSAIAGRPWAPVSVLGCHADGAIY
jgi:hypothetical protein